MGHSHWSDDAYNSLKSSYVSKSTDQIFTSSQVDKLMSPFGLKKRESRDSKEHPNTLAVSVFLDVTGSMGRIPELIVREKLGHLMNTFIDHKMPDVQVLFGAIGDHYTDHAPLQVGQFESGTEELTKWLTTTYLEGNGGGQQKESYLLAWLVGAHHTAIDCFEKRKQKGFIFTLGDEGCHNDFEKKFQENLLGYTVKNQKDFTARGLLKEAEKTHHVFHIHVNEGGYRNNSNILSSWKSLLGERLIICDDYKEIPELIATTVALMQGVNLSTAVSSYPKLVASNISKALVQVNSALTKSGTDGVVTL